MHERDKLKEAEHHLTVMKQDHDDPARFKYALSAFLSATRSVLQYALKEAKSRDGGQAWYDGSIASRPIVGFMKDQRDSNIHQEPVALNNDVAVTLSGIVLLTGSATAILRKADGTSAVTHSDDSSRPQAPAPRQPPTTARYTYRFPGWPAQHDALTLSEAYLSELRSFIDNGLAGDFISG